MTFPAYSQIAKHQNPWRDIYIPKPKKHDKTAQNYRKWQIQHPQPNPTSPFHNISVVLYSNSTIAMQHILEREKRSNFAVDNTHTHTHNKRIMSTFLRNVLLAKGVTICTPNLLRQHLCNPEDEHLLTCRLQNPKTPKKMSTFPLTQETWQNMTKVQQIEYPQIQHPPWKGLNPNPSSRMFLSFFPSSNSTITIQLQSWSTQKALHVTHKKHRSSNVPLPKSVQLLFHQIF